MAEVDLGKISKEEFIACTDEQFNSFQHYINNLSEAQLTELTDAAGWSVKDHLYHLGLSEGIISAILDDKPIHEAMGVDLETYKQGDDAVNAVGQKRSHEMPLADVLATMREKHEQAMQRVRATPEADFQRLFNDYRPNESPREGTVMLALVNNGFHHYQEHTPWIVDILNSGTGKMPKNELLERIEQGFQHINGYLDSLSESQLTQPSDAAGWTAKDHVIHMATWEDSILALLSGAAQWEAMNVPREIWKQGDDAINAVIQKRFQEMPLAEVRQKFRENHQRVLAKLQTLTDEELHRPFNYFQPLSKLDKPVILWIQGNTYLHFEAHQPWIAAIVKS